MSEDNEDLGWRELDEKYQMERSRVRLLIDDLLGTEFGGVPEGSFTARWIVIVEVVAGDDGRRMVALRSGDQVDASLWSHDIAGLLQYAGRSLA